MSQYAQHGQLESQYDRPYVFVVVQVVKRLIGRPKKVGMGIAVVGQIVQQFRNVVTRVKTR